MTIGVDFHVKTIEINNKKIKLQIWDVGGEERFRFLLPTYCLGCNSAFLLFDLTRPTTLDNLSEWTSIVRQKAGPIPIILVGSKIDLVTTNRKILKEHGIQIAKKIKCHDYIEVSAKENLNVDSAFKALTEVSIRNLR